MESGENRDTNILGKRIILRSILALTLTLVGAIFLELAISSHNKIQESKSNLHQQIDSIEPNIIQALWKVDPAAIRVAVRSLGNNPEVVRVAVRAQFRINDINEEFTRPGMENADCTDQIVRDYSRVKYRGLYIGSGTLNVCVSTDLLKAVVAAEPIWDNLLKSFGVAIIIAIVLYVLIRRSVIAPINRLISNVRENELGQDDHLNRDLWDNNDEIDELFRGLKEKAQIVDAAHRDDKLKMLGMLSSGVAHDFNNLLAIVSGNISLIEAEVANVEGVAPRVDAIKKSVRSGAAIIRSLQLLSGKNSQHSEVIEVGRVLDSMRILSDVLIQESTNISFDRQTNSEIFIDTGALEAAMLNLVLNARDAVSDNPDGRIIIRARTVEDAEASLTALEVEDNGIGIAQEHLARVRDPFFTTKGDKGGSGLGLAMVEDFVRNHMGKLDIRSRVGEGTCITMSFPTVVNAPKQVGVAAEDRQSKAVAVKKPCRVLVLDDELALARSISDLLSKLGYDSSWTNNPYQVLQDVKITTQYDIFICDVLMGAITGPELFQQIRATANDQCPPVIYISGAIPDAWPNAFNEANMETILYKPFKIRELDAMIQSVMAQ